MQLQCRDRNRIALQADLLGASAVGIRTCSAHGRPPALRRPARRQRRVRPGLDAACVDGAQACAIRSSCSTGASCVAAAWIIGAVENPFAPPLRFRAERLGKKVAAGAQFVQTQFIFDVPVFERWMQQVRDLGLDKRCYMLAGVGPIKSLRALEHMRARCRACSAGRGRQALAGRAGGSCPGRGRGAVRRDHSASPRDPWRRRRPCDGLRLGGSHSRNPRTCWSGRARGGERPA